MLESLSTAKVLVPATLTGFKALHQICTTYQIPPSRYLRIDDPLAGWCVDRAVHWATYEPQEKHDPLRLT